MPDTFNISWDADGQREYELGVSRGVLYPMNANGTYGSGVAWNGLTGVDENPDGADINDIWADNIKYASFQSPENHKGTIKAYMFPDEFYPCNGMVMPSDAQGLVFSGQNRQAFGFCYRTELGTDVNQNAGYKLHLVYNCRVQPSSRSHATKNENPDPEEMSWEYSSTPVSVTGVTGVEQCSVIEIKSTDFTSDKMAAIEALLYGSGSTPGTLPAPGTVYTTLKTAAGG